MRKSLALFALAGSALMMPVVIPLAVGAQGADHPPCPGVRIEAGGGSSFTVPAPPDGWTWYYVASKSANNDHVMQSTAVGSTFTSGEFNANGVEQDISHVDLCKVQIATTTTTTSVDPTTTTTSTTLPDTTTTSSTTTEVTTSTTTSIPDTSSTTTTTSPESTSTSTLPETTTTEPGTTTTTPTTPTTVPGTTSSTTTTSTPMTPTTDPDSVPALPQTR